MKKRIIHIILSLGLFGAAYCLVSALSLASRSEIQSGERGGVIDPSNYEDRLIQGGSVRNLYEKYLDITSSEEAMWRFLKGTRAKDSLYQEVFDKFVAIDAERAFSLARSFVGNDRIYYLAAVINETFEDDPLIAFSMIEEVAHLDLGCRESFQWIKEDPKRYADHISKLPACAFRSSLLRQTAEAWQLIDPEGALEWASNLSVDEQSDAIEGLVNAWLDTGLGEAELSFFNNEIKGKVRSEFGLRIAEKMIAQGSPDDALQWIDLHLSGNGRLNAVSSLAKSLGKTAPETVAHHIMGIERGYVRLNAGVELINQWISKDTGSAAEWIRGLSEKDFPERELWLNYIGDAWYTDDPEEVMKYIKSSDDVRPAFIEVIARAEWRQNPEGGLLWLESLPEIYRASAESVINEFIER